MSWATRYLGDWTDRDGNSNVEEGLLTGYLTRCGYTPAQISVGIHNARFRDLMDRFMPKWQFFSAQLNRFPVSHEDWGY
ncbi:MAG: hypothetical protein JEZ11_14105 [Desulfobacterales bacterium]|nr:hypothetical protein [Desulfobacterales bacterium]